MTTLQKYTYILKAFNERDERILTAYDETLQDELNLSSKQIGRMLDEIAMEYNNIEIFKQARRKAYKLVKPIDILEEALGTSEELGMVWEMVRKNDPDMFKTLEEHTKEHQSVYQFRSTPLEDFASLESKEVFKKLKDAIEKREYRKIKFFNEEKESESIKCLKLVFMNENWYLAYVDSDDILKYARISFIENVLYSHKSEQYQSYKVKKHLAFIDQTQNAMTLFGIKPQIATIKATANIAKYFKKDMKIFLSSQRYKEELTDGSVIFTLEYTQSLEILPFIQKWLPDLVILEPQVLKDEYITKLEKSIQNQKENHV